MATVVAASSCGVGGEEEATAIDDVDFELLGTTTSTTSTTVPARPLFTVTFYWHTAADDRLVAIERQREEAPSAQETLDELIVGPSADELEANPDLLSRIDASLAPELDQVDGTTYQVRIQQSSEDSLTTEQAAEIICTLTQFSAIDAIAIVDPEGVAFTLSGSGAVPIEGPARRSDFSDCVEDPLPGENADEDGGGDGETVDGEDDPDAESTTTTGG